MINFNSLPEVVQAPDVVGLIPKGDRASFSSPLAIKNRQDQTRAYEHTWEYNEQLEDSGLHPDLQHFIPFINEMVLLGGLTLRSRDDFLWVKVNQGSAAHINMPIMWHRDDFSESYRRIVVSDILGTIYETDDGERKETPDYGMLLLDSSVFHKAQDTRKTRPRTRLTVTRFPTHLRSVIGL
jgi:hypothetical protein